MHDFPLADGLFFLLLRAVSFVARDYARALNYYFLLTFPLTALTAVFAFRRFGASRVPAVAGALLYAFLPCHFLRGEEHLFLASYFVVPLSAAVALRLFLDGGRKAGRLEVAAIAAVCLLSGSGGIYYAFFSCFLFLVGGAVAALRCGAWRPFRSAVVLVGLVAAGVLVNVAPNLLYKLRHGPNAEAVVRDPAQSEVFGLKLAQLLLPVPGHRVPTLARLRARYDTALAPLVNENGFATLGLVGASGFLLLTAGALRRGSRGVGEGLVVLNLAAVLLATSGGFGTLFGFLVSPWIRAYNRLSVFIAFFSLFAVVLVLSKAERLARDRGLAWLARAGVGALLVVGLLDQVPRSFVPHYDHLRRMFAADAAFIGRVEAALPAGAMVFQLPYSPFPEPAMVQQMHWYDHLRGYLHSRSLRWSYGAMRGRYAGLWQAWVAGQPAEAMLRRLAEAGFAGVYIDRSGYEDGGRGIEAELTRRTGAGPLVSEDGRLALFDIRRVAGPLHDAAVFPVL
jgi:phosphoglycerol transferase